MISTKFKTAKRLMTRVHFNRIEMQRGGSHVWTVHNSLGSCRVLYTDTVMPDGKYAVSQPMSREVANDYASINNRFDKVVAVVIDRDAPVPMATATVN